MTQPKSGMTVAVMDDGVVHLVAATYGGPTFRDEPSWRLACDMAATWRGYASWRGRETGAPLSCIACIEWECEHARLLAEGHED